MRVVIVQGGAAGGAGSLRRERATAGAVHGKSGCAHHTSARTPGRQQSELAERASRVCSTAHMRAATAPGRKPGPLAHMRLAAPARPAHAFGTTLSSRTRADRAINRSSESHSQSSGARCSEPVTAQSYLQARHAAAEARSSQACHATYEQVQQHCGTAVGPKQRECTTRSMFGGLAGQEQAQQVLVSNGYGLRSPDLRPEVGTAAVRPSTVRR